MKHIRFVKSLTRHNSTSVCDSITNHRKWINFKDEPGHQSNKFTVSSYNLLSRHYMWTSVYSYLPSKYIDWTNRFGLINKNMKDLTHLSDIMCFQEMEYKLYRDYWQKYMLEQNYDSRFQIKRKSLYWQKSPIMMDGVSVFVSKEKFRIINYEKVDYSDYFNDEKLFDQTEDLKNRASNRNTVALVLALEHLPTREVLFVTNTHLYWSPKHPDVKLLQTYVLTKVVRKTIKRVFSISDSEFQSRLEKGSFNILMVGDYNSQPNSLVYRFLSNGSVNLSKDPGFRYDYGTSVPSVLENCLQAFESPYRSLFEKKMFEKTTYTQNFKQIIDYIWFNKNNKDLELIKVLGDLDPKYLEKYPGFPNDEFPSDHIPILAEFNIKV